MSLLAKEVSMDDIKIKDLASEVLAVLDLQQKYFAARKAAMPEAASILQAAKSRESKLRKTCETIIHGSQTKLFT